MEQGPVGGRIVINEFTLLDGALRAVRERLINNGKLLELRRAMDIGPEASIWPPDIEACAQCALQVEGLELIDCGRRLMEIGRYEEAHVCFEAGLFDNGDVGEARRALVQLGHAAKAIRKWALAFHCFYAGGDAENLEFALQQSLEDPDGEYCAADVFFATHAIGQPELLLKHGDRFAKMGKTTDAAECYASGNYWQRLVRLAGLLMAQGKIDDALTVLETMDDENNE